MVIEELKKLFKETGRESINYWNSLVEKKTKTGTIPYRAGMFHRITHKKFDIGLRGRFAPMLERGFSSYSLKPILLRRAKFSKRGTAYRRIPIGDTGEIRTITWRSRGWRHPGFVGYQFLPQVKDYFHKNFQKKVEKFFRDLDKKIKF